MFDWCHSGLEGYCKAAANMLGDPSTVSSWLPFCNDLLPDRTPDNLSKAWTFSNERKGRSCRQTIFEKSWLNNKHAKTYVREAAAFAQNPRGAFSTIEPGSAYEQRLSSSSSDERRHLAVRQCEQDAIKACAAHVLHTVDDDADEVSSLVSLVMSEDFPIAFFAHAMPAIERGFLSERYRPSDAHQFSLTLGSLLGGAHACLLSPTSRGTAYAPFARFLEVLVAGLIYGPSHPMALGYAGDETEQYLPYDGVQEVRSDVIRITQIFDEAGLSEGYSETYRPGQAIFFGRCPDLKEFVDRCPTILEDAPETLDALHACETFQFPLSEQHAAVSNIHGMMLYEDSSWRYYDLRSSNGTSIEAQAISEQVNGVVEVRPGDRLRLGVPAEANDANMFWYAAILRLSCYVEIE